MQYVRSSGVRKSGVVIGLRGVGFCEAAMQFPGSSARMLKTINSENREKVRDYRAQIIAQRYDD